MNLTRAYSPGRQRYGTTVWSGDIAATWDTLRKQISEGLNFAVTGGAKWTLDIGAFFVAPQHKGRQNAWFWCGDYADGYRDKGYQELYVRWFQLGAFLPMFRSHGTDTPREVWRFGEPGDVMYDTLVKFDLLRYRLLPYIYSLAGWETHRGYTMLRNLAFDFRDDPQVYDVADRFMFGPALMVCPVTEAMHYGPDSVPLAETRKTRSVYLPVGCDWYDFWNGQRYAGGQTIDADAPLDKLPLFVRAGSLLPLGLEVQCSWEQPDAPWELRIYLGANGAFDIYEDAGDGYGYEQGAFSWTPITWDDASQTLTFAERAGSFSEMVPQRVYNVVVVRDTQGVGGEPETRFDRSVVYAGNALREPISS